MQIHVMQSRISWVSSQFYLNSEACGKQEGLKEGINNSNKPSRSCRGSAFQEDRMRAEGSV